MIHANKRWPDAITTNLWPYATRMANESINATPWLYNPNKASPNSIFANSDVQENLKHWYRFGCPVYVINDQIQQGKRPKGCKWMERSQIGIYLERYTKQSRNIALVLNIKNGRVSPQFHFKMDPMFHTVKNTTRQERVQPKWQEAAGFKIGKGKGGETNAKNKRGTQPNQPATPHIPPTEEGTRLNLPPQPVQRSLLSQASEGFQPTIIRTEPRATPQVAAR